MQSTESRSLCLEWGERSTEVRILCLNGGWKGKRPDICFWRTKPVFPESRVSVVWGRVRVSEGESQLFRRGESMFPGHEMDAKFPWSILWQQVAVFGAIPCHGMGVAGLTFIPCPGNAGSRRAAAEKPRVKAYRIRKLAADRTLRRNRRDGCSEINPYLVCSAISRASILRVSVL